MIYYWLGVSRGVLSALERFRNPAGLELSPFCNTREGGKVFRAGTRASRDGLSI